ncbi:hypothetical protein M0R72_07990 [Candidatus Pacearchaeota archaeon]|jgi:hypothetical protein|nr:hypothetical protein [Candidatus Pacearchaeota archaeon]
MTDTDKKPTVLIGIPSYDGFIHNRLYEEIDSLVLYSKANGVDVFTKGHITFIVAVCSLLPLNRRFLVDDALKIGADYLLTIDSDTCCIPPDALVRLLAHQKDLVGAVQYKKAPPHVPLFGTFSNIGDKKMAYVVDYEPDKLLEVDGLGFGFTLISTRLLRDCLTKNPNHELFPCSELYGEDGGFCRIIHDYGYEAYIDTGLIVGHKGDYVYGVWDASLYADELRDLQVDGCGLTEAVKKIEVKYGSVHRGRAASCVYGLTIDELKTKG